MSATFSIPSQTAVDFNPDYFPNLSAAGRGMLQRLIAHPCAPYFRNQSGHRLNDDELKSLRGYIDEALSAHCFQSDTLDLFPEWLIDFLVEGQLKVPHYRQNRAGAFTDLPTTCRADLSQDITQFVPDDLPLDRLILFSTSGTTGHPLTIPSHPMVAARYQAFHRRALAHFGITPLAGRGDVAVALVGAQQRCFTYASINPLQDDAGLVKINLNPAEWRDAADPARYLDDLAPELITGDPLSLSALAELPLRHRPRAVLSTSMQMTQGLRESLSQRFACPVLDIYSMNEAGPIAVFDPQRGGYILLQPCLWLEILGADDLPVATGEMGEITLTGGFNPWLPLRRYRTGDFARLQVIDGLATLLDLSGRPPVRFKTKDGQWVNNVDLSQALQPFLLAQYTIHQDAEGAIEFQCAGIAPEAIIRNALRQILGDWPIEIHSHMALPDKVIQYTSAYIE